jgi:mRNA interferase RelE/StbE
LTSEPAFWKVRFNKKAEKEFDKIDRPIQQKITTYVTTHIICAKNPRLFGHALKGSLRDLWRYRVGNYRLICYIDDKNQMIKIMHIGHRKDVYETVSFASLFDADG